MFQLTFHPIFDYVSLCIAVLDRFITTVSRILVSGDFWKLTKAGKLEYDGSGYLKNEDGKYINRDGTVSDKPGAKTIGDALIERGLINILGMKRGAEESTIAQKLIQDAGMTLSKNKDWNTDANLGKSIDIGDAFDAIQNGLVMNSKYDYPATEVGIMFKKLGSIQTSALQFNQSFYAKNNFAAPAFTNFLDNLSAAGPGYLQTTTTNPDGSSSATDLGNILTKAQAFVSDSNLAISLRGKYVNQITKPNLPAGTPSLSWFETAFRADGANLSAEQKANYAKLEAAAATEQALKKGYPAYGAQVRGAPLIAGSVVDTTWCIGMVERAVALMQPTATAIYGAEKKAGYATADQMVRNLNAAGYSSTTSGSQAQLWANEGNLVVAGLSSTTRNPGHVAVVYPQSLTSYVNAWGPKIVQAGQWNGVGYAYQGFGADQLKNIKYYLISKK